jgi:hypothetical protein
MTHTGKIGRLPEELQEELNRRLGAKTPDAQLLQWLNGLPEVQAVLLHDFGGQKITRRNLKAWKTGGYQHWVTEETAFLDAFERILSQQRTQSPPADKLTPDSQINSKANQMPADAGQFFLPLSPALNPPSRSAGQSKLEK